MAAKSKDVDLDVLGRDVRAGILSYDQMAAKHKISKGRISQLKKANGWDTDLSAKIKAKTEAKLNAHALNGKLNAKQKVADEAMVEAGSNLQANVLLGHRQDIATLKKTIVAMAEELCTLSHSELQEALEIVLLEKTSGMTEKQQTAMYKAFDSAMGLNGRTTAGKNLVAALGVLIEKERQAFGIDKNTDGPQSIGEFLATME